MDESATGQSMPQQQQQQSQGRKLTDEENATNFEMPGVSKDSTVCERWMLVVCTGLWHLTLWLE